MNTEQTTTPKKTDLLKEEYPLNLLLCIANGWKNIELPNELTPDICAGIEYAITLLGNREQKVIRMRYAEQRTLSDIGQVFGVNSERIRQIETRAVRRLREPQYFQYIRHGVQGVIQRKTESAHSKGYELGYSDGYRQALDDAEKGVAADGISVNILSLPVESLSLSGKTCAILREAGFEQLRDLIGLSKKDTQKIKGLTVDRRCAIAGSLSRYGLQPDGWKDYYIVWSVRQNKQKENDYNDET